jgi:hypothetical protein
MWIFENPWGLPYLTQAYELWLEIASDIRIA